MGAKSLVLVSCLLVTCLCAACGLATPSAAPTQPTAVARSTAPPASPATALASTSPCPDYPAATYGIDPDQVADTGGGAQLVTVIAPSAASWTGIFTAWSRAAYGCWVPVSFAGQPAQPYQAQTGYGGLLPISQRVPGDWATPTGLFPFGTTVYGNSTVSPTTHYPYYHLVCGDWWDEQPGSPTYDTFQQVPCGITPAYGDDSEALWTEVQPYQHFIDIKMPSPPDNGAGIFLHDYMPVGYTEGCVALPDAELDAVLGWLNPADSPHILIAVG
jgi:L,D-peptidoglycan transpeptidase YkuD (ErfK/YbiS/YcfS/YnhG family)